MPQTDEEAAAETEAATSSELDSGGCQAEPTAAVAEAPPDQLPDLEELLRLCRSRSAQRRWLAPSLRRLRRRQALRRHALAHLFGLRHPAHLCHVLGRRPDDCGDAYVPNLRRAVAPPPPPLLTAAQQPQTLGQSRQLQPPPHLLHRRPQLQQKLGAAGDEANGFRKSAATTAAEEAANLLSTHDASGKTRNPADFMNIFLKGTQSANPHNDYSQHFVDSGLRPQNFIRDAGLENRFVEYPKLRELIRLKDELVKATATPPMYHRCDLLSFNLNDLNCKFDAILIEPPLEEYNRSHGAYFPRYWSWDEVERLNIEEISSPRSFVWLWCGNGESLEAARRCLRKWGYRRCEDICWIKTNKGRPGHKLVEGENALFQQSKEHCLMGIKGTVRRSTDGEFIHANVDIDLIIEEEPEWGQKAHPAEIFRVIEHFCLGRRRLHVFARDDTVRAGWLSVGPELTASNFDARIYSGYFSKDPAACLTGCTEDIERLRPKSPPARGPAPPKPGEEAAAAAAAAGVAIGAAAAGPGLPIGAMAGQMQQQQQMQMQQLQLPPGIFVVPTAAPQQQQQQQPPQQIVSLGCGMMQQPRPQLPT